ncbi:hypothetical protein BBO99_00008538 [Phytophthora kernoviae]|uniref:Uncharacterized protein n=1 Tax=Phytophthora kernoviae TaxID=325452 RepID=A0A3R7NB54_9STRA|nr:hypothetical protein BBI17_008592 [Phytophthora kernoviae]RLN75115.1 hypothetical protein BBO99_00008538 [Phytophthora kernoviae]
MQNSTRKRQKAELSYLRAKVQDLEVELASKRRELMTGKSEESGNHSVTVKLRGRRARWQRIAKHQLVEKQRAEMQNLQLRESLMDQIKLAKSLQKLLKKHAAKGGQATEAAQLQARLEFSKYSDGVSEAALYENLLGDMDEVYAEVESICARHPVMQNMEEDSDVSSLNIGETDTLYLEATNSKIIPFGMEKTCSAVWHCLSQDHVKLADGTYHGVASSPDSIRAKAIMTLRVKSLQAQMQMRFAMKKFVEKERVVLTLESASESEGPRDLLHGLKMMQRAWVVIRPVPAEPEDIELDANDQTPEETIIQLCIRLTPSLSAGALDATGHRTEDALDRMANYWTKPSRILLLGLDGAGKTTLLYKMKLGEAVTTIPTIGFNVETFKYKNIEFTAWDIGGQSKLRPLWRFYYEGADAVVFVIDSADRFRVDEAVLELHRVFEDDALRDSKLLVLANKQDQPNCLSVDELREKLSLHRVTKNPYHISKTVAVSGQGVDEGMLWLSKAITTK